MSLAEKDCFIFLKSIQSKALQRLARYLDRDFSNEQQFLSMYLLHRKYKVNYLVD